MLGNFVMVYDEFVEEDWSVVGLLFYGICVWVDFVYVKV